MRGASMETAVRGVRLALTGFCAWWLISFAMLAHGQWLPATSPGLSRVTVGAQPEAIALARSARMMAVTLRRDRALILMNPDTGQVLRTVSLAKTPVAVALNTLGTRAFVLFRDAGVVGVVDTATGSLTSEWSIGGQLVGAALRPDDQELVVADSTGRRLLALSPATGQVLKSVTIAETPTAIAFGYGGQRLFVAGGGSVASYDASTLALLRSVAVADEVSSVGFLESSLLTIAVARRIDAIGVLNADGGIVDSILQIDGLPEALALDQSDAKAFVATQADLALTRADARTRQLEGRYFLPGRPSGVVFDPVSRTVLVALSDDDELIRLDPRSASLASRLQLDSQLRDIAIDNRAHQVVWIDDKKDELTRMRLSDSSRETIKLPGRPRRVVIDESRNLAFVAFSTKRHQIAVVDLSGAQPTLRPTRVDLPGELRGVALDPGRGVIVAVSGNRILVIDVATMTLVRSVSGDQPYVDIAVSTARGTAYAVTEDGQIRLFSTERRALVGALLGVRASQVQVWEDQGRAVLLDRRLNRAQILDLGALKVIATVALPRRPSAGAIQEGSGVAVVSSPESGVLTGLGLEGTSVAETLGRLAKAGRVAVSSRFNRAYAVSGESSVVAQYSLPNPVPETTALSPSEVEAGAGPIELRVTGKRFVDRSTIRVDGTDVATRWVSTKELTATLPASLLANGRIAQVTVFSPAPAGGASRPLPLTIKSLVPSLRAVSPPRLDADGEPKQIVLTGENFQSNAVALFREVPIPTTYVGRTQLSATIPGSMLNEAGTFHVRVENPGAVASNPVDLLVMPPSPRVTGFTPTSGSPGTIVTVNGRFFGATVPGNIVRFNGVDAIVTSASSSQLKALVPDSATSGPISVVTSTGTGVSSGSFQVTSDQDFAVVLSPASVTLYQNGAASVTARLSDTGRVPFSGLARLLAEVLPPGVTASFEPDTLSAFRTVQIRLRATPSAGVGTFDARIQADAQVGAQTLVRKATVTINLKDGAGVTGVTGRFVDPNGNGIPGVLVRADTGQAQQPEVRTDAAGNFLLTGLPSGDVTLRMDATTANSLYPIWPYLAKLTPGKILQIPDWQIAPPPAAERFSQINNATQDQKITDPRFPGLEITLPAGTTITGWDGVQKTRIAVERHDVEKLPVPAPPTNTRSAYQLYFGTPMGGVPSKPVPVALPNDLDMDPGEKAELWYFDGSPINGTGEWKVAGTGTVSSDGKRIVSDPGVGIPRFCGVCGLACFGNPNPPEGGAGNGGGGPGGSGGGGSPPPPPCNPESKCCLGGGGSGGAAGGGPRSAPDSDGNPVNLATGQELPRVSDFQCGGRVSIEWSRMYNPIDAFNRVGNAAGTLGFGWAANYDVVLLAGNEQKLLILAGNDRVTFASGASGFVNSTDRRFDGAILVQENAQSWRINFKTGRIWKFQPFGVGANRGVPFYLTEIVEQSGNALQIGRRTDSRITSIVAGTRSLSVRYGANGFASEIVDQLGRRTRYEYTGTDRIASVIDPEGGVTRYTYLKDSDFESSPACSAPPRGERLKTIQYPGQTASTVNHYGSSRRILRQTLADGSELKFAYKVVGACVSNVASPATRCSGTNCPDVDSSENYDSGWRIYGGTVVATTVTDALGRTYTRRSDSRGYATEYTDRSGGASKYDLDSNGRVKSVSDSLGRVWRYFHDDNGNVVRRVDPLGRSVLIQYDGKWQKPTMISRSLADGVTVSWRYAYSSQTGSLLSVTDPLSRSTIFEYSSNGDLTSVQSPSGSKTKLSYSEAGDIALVTDALGNSIAYGQDALGRMVTTTDAAGSLTRVELDNLDRIRKIVDPLGGEASLVFDQRNDLYSVSNQRSISVARYEYDPLGRVTAETDVLGRRKTYARDAVGRLVAVTDRKGLTTRFSYDDVGRLTRTEYPEGSVQSRVYDAGGRLIEIREPNSAISFSYDQVDRIVASVQTNAAGRIAITYSYDNLDRVVRRIVSRNESVISRQEYKHNLAGQVVERVQLGSQLGILTEETVRYTYDQAGRLVSVRLPNGVLRELTYDATDRLASMTYLGADGSPIETISYSYDAVGRRVSRRISGESVPETPMRATYDALDQLVSLTLNPSSPGEKTYSHVYDGNGNLITKVGQDGQTSYRWDSRDRLIGMTSPGLAISFAYDVLDRRVAVSVNGRDQFALYDNQEQIATVGDGSVSEVWLSGADPDDVIAQYASDERSFNVVDGLGSVVAQLDEQGNVKNLSRYSPFGESRRGGAEGSGSSLGFSGRVHDDGGLVFLRARYYDPVAKRFLSRDPVGLAGGLNPYRYVFNNPVGITDPSGRFVGALVVGGVAAVGAIGAILVAKDCFERCDSASKKGSCLNASTGASDPESVVRDAERFRAQQGAFGACIQVCMPFVETMLMIGQHPVEIFSGFAREASER